MDSVRSVKLEHLCPGVQRRGRGIGGRCPGPVASGRVGDVAPAPPYPGHEEQTRIHGVEPGPRLGGDLVGLHAAAAVAREVGQAARPRPQWTAVGPVAGEAGRSASGHGSAHLVEVGDVLTRTALSAVPAIAAVAVSGDTATVTPVRPGPATVGPVDFAVPEHKDLRRPGALGTRRSLRDRELLAV